MSVSGRDMALKALAIQRKSSSHSELPLQEVLPQLSDSREQGFCTRLYYSVLQNLTLLDYYIQGLCKQPLSRLQPQVLDILRLCCAQLLFFDRVPAFSAVDEAVNQCRRIAPKAAGMVNAIGRKLAEPENRCKINGTATERLSVQYSHPQWFVDLMLKRFGSEAECASYLKANNEIPPIFLQGNPLKGFERSRALELNLQPSVVADTCFTVDNLGNPLLRQWLDDGLVYVQDPASLSAVIAADPKPGMRVMDICCAPGGKSFSSAILMDNRGEMLSFDLAGKKLPAVCRQARQLGITIMSIAEADGRQPLPQYDQTADVVFTDVPCSGFGVIRKKPEIRWKNPDEIRNLPTIGAAILENACRYVKPGGTLLYSTCTVLEAENEAIVDDFLMRHPEFRPVDFTLPIGHSEKGMLTLYPHVNGTDGFFIAKMTRCLN